LLADLALESFPIERSNILILSTWRFLLFLSKHPGLEALEVNKTNRASTLASDNQWVGLIIFVTPTDSALNLVLTGIIDIFGALHLHSLSQFLVIKLFLGHVDVIASEVLDSESNTTKLDGIKLFDFIIIFAVFVFQRSGH